MKSRKKTYTVKVGHIPIGGGNPIIIQSMTNTPTANIKATVQQTLKLSKAGSEIVRLTINDESAAKAIPSIIQEIRQKGCLSPIIGDFHFNGHILLRKYPQCAKLLDKYRINPGNVGKGTNKNSHFSEIIKIAINHDKPIRIGINYGSLDQELLARLMNQNQKLKNPKSSQEVIYQAMIQSALKSSAYAHKLGLKKNKIILSVKMSKLQDMVNVYTQLSRQCNYPLHLGLTEAGSNIQGVVSSSAALGILLHQGIGDTIRISLTPEKKTPRTQEVLACQLLLQSMGLRYFSCDITSCPGCGRTNTEYFNRLTEEIKNYILKRMPQWKKVYPGVEKLTIAIMGCVVNGPGESKHADIGISLPGASEKLLAPIYADGKKVAVLKEKGIKKDFLDYLERYIQKRFGAINQEE